MPNRLIGETSPYLQQHADNPVDWYPWGEEALARARREGKPILLSVGYSACHWCHVMAHESFEDAATAAVMNELFINIKVDREERPDIDQIYQSALHMLTQRSGGWPLTMFLTPEQQPFFGGTYFPNTARHQLPAFVSLLRRAADVFAHQKDDIARQSASLLEGFAGNQPEPGVAALELDGAPLLAATQYLKGTFDRVHGGFGGAPKFPHPTEIELCLRRSGLDAELAHVALHTLTRMALGGIHDQLGGGFCRYSVDQFWMIPHFEKMLYDNGPLLRLYADAWAMSGDPLMRRVAEETAAWVMREMQSLEGGYYSSFDADSEHEEGKFYVWDRDQAHALLDDDEYAVVAAHYGFARVPNFEERLWHLCVMQPLAQVAQQQARSVQACEQLLASARGKLFAARSKRVWPGRDEKILTSWNALMIHGMAHAARLLGRADWLESARRACMFIRRSMWQDAHLRATYKDGRAHLNAYLDDYAFMLAALIEMLQCDYHADDMRFATELADALLARFEDTAGGGFYFTSHDHEKLIHRQKPSWDNATPSGNGVAAWALNRMGYLTGNMAYVEAAGRVLTIFNQRLREHAAGFASLLMCLEETLTPCEVLVLRGPEAEVKAWQAELARLYLPRTMVLAVPDSLLELPQALDKPARGVVNAWLCQGVTCLEPIATLEGLLAVIDKNEFVEHIPAPSRNI